MCQYLGSHAQLQTHKLWNCSTGKIYILLKYIFSVTRNCPSVGDTRYKLRQKWTAVQQRVMLETEVQHSLVSETQEGETLLLSLVLRNGEIWREKKLSKQGSCKIALCLKWQTYPNTKINDTTICFMCLSYNGSIIYSICVSGHINV